MLKGKRVIIGISGGIAAYKSLYLIRLFRKAGAEVRVVVTENALWFVTKISIEALSQNKVYDKTFGPENDYTAEHISLTDWADVFVIAPATANVIGKYANGIADDALSTSIMAFDKQVFIAPAMNCKMYKNFAFQKNLVYLRNNGVMIIEPAEGYLACGYEGKGRMEEPEEIFRHVEQYFSKKKDLEGKKILVTAGPTYEEIDPVRFLGNHSTGKMGFAVANALAERGAEVTLITGPVNIDISHPLIKRIDVVSALQMFDYAINQFPDMDGAICAAAVSDFRPVIKQKQKIKSESNKLVLELVPNKDILAAMGKMKTKGQILVGFALETENEIENSKAKLKKKNLDFIVLNSLNEKGAGFGVETNKISIIDNKEQVLLFELKGKTLVAHDIIDKLVTCFHNKD